MGTVKNLIFTLLYPFVTLYVRLKFKNFLALRMYLQDSPKPHTLLWHSCGRWFWKQGSFVGRGARFGGQPFFPHGCMGVFISNNAVIGRDAVIFHQVTIGSNTLPGTKRPGAPVIGDGVYIGAGAKIIGGVTVGDRCRIGANAVVAKDLPPDSVAVCAATTVIQKENLDNAFRVDLNGVPCVARNGYLVRESAEGSGTGGS